MGEKRVEGDKDVGPGGRVTISQAATLLGVHPNTVHNRVKAGIYEAEKVATENGLAWMIDRNSLLNNPLAKDLQRAPSQIVGNPQVLIRDLLRPFVEDLGAVREELGAERVRREQAEERITELERQLETLRGTREAPQSASGGEGGRAEHPLPRSGPLGGSGSSAARGNRKGGEGRNG